MRNGSAVLVWPLALLTSALGAAVIFDTEPGISWSIWVAAASLSVLVARLASVKKIEAPLAILLGWATLLSLRFALHTSDLNVFVILSTRCCLARRHNLGAPPGASYPAKPLRRPILAPSRWGRRPRSVPILHARPLAAFHVPDQELCFAPVVICRRPLASRSSALGHRSRRCLATRLVLSPADVLLPVPAVRDPRRQRDRSAPARAGASQSATTPYNGIHRCHRTAHGAVERRRRALAIRAASALLSHTTTTGRN